MFGGAPTTEVEDKRLAGLRERGINVPEELFQRLTDKGRDKQLEEALAAGAPEDFSGMHEGSWVNTRFLKTWNESDLRPEDIWGYAAFFEEYGEDWIGTFSEDKRRGIARKVLDGGGVREHHGTIDVDFSVLEQKAKEEKKEEEHDHSTHNVNMI